MSHRTVIHFIVAGSLALVARYAPIPNLPESGSICLSVFVLAVYFWTTEAIPLYVTSFLILFLEAAYIAPKVGTSYQVFLAPFFSNVIALFLGGLLMARALHKHHIDELVATRVISLMGEKPANVLLGVMLTSAFLSMWMSNTATTAIMFIIALVLVEQFPEGSTFQKAFFLGIPFAATIGGMGTPIGTPPNAIAIQLFNQVSPKTVGFLEWMVCCIPIVLLVLFILWRLILAFFPAPDIRVSVARGREPELSVGTVIVVLTFCVTVSLWLASGIHGIPSGIVALIPVVVLLSTGILLREDFNSISWDVLFLVAGGMTLGLGITHSGLSDWVLAHVPLARLPLIWLVLSFMVVGAVLASFMSNTATANILIPLASALAMIETFPLVAAIALATSGSMVLPVSTPANALAYSSGRVTYGDLFKVGLLISSITIVVILTLGLGWWRMLGYY